MKKNKFVTKRSFLHPWHHFNTQEKNPSVNKIISTCLVALGIFGLALGNIHAAYAQGSFENYAFTGKAGTQGLGGDLVTDIIPTTLNGRLTVAGISADKEDGVEGVDYSFDIQLLTMGALLDWYPLSGGFRVTAGGLLNFNEIDMKASLAAGETVEIGDESYTGAQVGSLRGDINFDTFAPYLGVGWGNPLKKNRNPWSFHVDAGVMFQGDPEVNLNASGGTLSNTEAFQSNLEKEKTNFEDEISKFRFYPVLSLGASYRF